MEAFESTCTDNTWLLFAVNEDDPTKEQYHRSLASRSSRVEIVYVDASSMVEALNLAAMNEVDGARPAPFAVGFMGDDHRPRTVGWDTAYLAALRNLGGAGIVYGDDLLQGKKLPTQCAMTSNLIRAMGWMAPPVLRHMYVDNAWKAIGDSLGILWYMSEVIVEHMHPIAGKAEWDEGHKRVNDPDIYREDGERYRDWIQNGFSETLQRIANSLGVKA
jgi:hypothetical protein